MWPEQNGCHFANDTFKCIFLNENVGIFINISLRFIPKNPVDKKSALVFGNNLEPNRQQAITWNNVTQDLRGFVISQGCNGLM